MGEWRPCRGCGGRIRSDNKSGYCTRSPQCRTRKAQGWEQSHPGYHRDLCRDSYATDPIPQLFRATRTRAKRRGIPFEITVEDLRDAWRDTCPVFDVPLAKGAGAPSPWSPSLDKIEPARGYVPGNIQILSFKANSMKLDASRDELIQFARWVLDNEGIAHE